MAVRKNRVLAISSGGGHWVELRRLSRAFEGCHVTWCTTHPDYREDLSAEAGDNSPRFFWVPEANRMRKLRMIGQFFSVFWVLLRVRPGVIVSTGSSPGFFAVCIGKLLFRAKTVWVQSIADTEGMSRSGKLAGRFADLWLTQWEHLAQPEGPHYHGAIV
ncbi:MAG: UDP-N-acetylglucosamine--LPS N-acetylglucosamine transferase [Planctomycetota bacterium]|nr:MAG: UDP-N-acetylglucosamine--LPS N-acetylglucosamine transferase [Planctomycetota bacterium]